ncbi:MAG: cupin domain-containing protein [Planctomycetes bacterium]|nr:cupin domain-containing protein [Planctomycetota bacterium]
MSLPKAKPGEVIDVRPLGPRLAKAKTEVLVKSDEVEVLRLVLRDGKRIDTHSAPGEALIHCLEGEVELNLADGARNLSAGEMVYLPASEPHSVQAVADSVLLVTLLLSPTAPMMHYEANSSDETLLDSVDEASDESFPASDPSSHTPISSS